MELCPACRGDSYLQKSTGMKFLSLCPWCELDFQSESDKNDGMILRDWGPRRTEDVLYEWAVMAYHRGLYPGMGLEQVYEHFMEIAEGGP